MRWFNESRNAPHIGRGTALALIFWAFGAYLFSLHWAMTASFIGVLAASVSWEFYDLSRKEKSDGFDFWDIVADTAGWALFALSILVYQVLEKKLYNHGGLF